jgi:serine/threonine-protein kinase/endoribonuclease IRE1
MPRRRPPGVGTTTLIAALLVLPWLTTAAQQQQPPHHVERRPSPGGLYADTVLPAKPRKHTRNASNRAEYTALNSQNERALATDVSSAPANPAVRAPPVRNAAPSGGLQPKSARSLKDWEVEDFVLLATVDGRIHATDRYDGHELWALDIGRPMLETVYNLNDSGSDNSPGREPFVWIVEPKEDGALYILTPGPHPVLSSLGMTVKQLTEDLAPYSSDDPPVVYTAEKKNLLLVVDARTGAVTRSFSSGSSMVTDSESCVPEQTFGSRERECRGVFNIGQTEYTVSIHNKITGDNICTIKYSEWTPNNRDRDLQAQYLETMDGQYIYSIFDGHAIAKDHNRSKKAAQRPVFRRKFSSPVARVFDVARPYDDSEPEPALVLLPQPPGPAFLEDKANFVWLNTTETGSWYAMSEVNYPAVTDSAPQALCYSPEWSNRELANWNGRHYLPERAGLVGVHVLDYQADYAPPEVPRIDAPVSTQEPIVPRPQLPSVPANKVAEKQPEPMIEDQTRKNWLKSLVLLGVLFSAGGCFLALGQSPQLEPLKRYLTSRASKTASAKWPAVQAPALLEPISQAVDEDLASSAIDNLAAAPDSSKPLAGEQVPVSLLDVEQEKKVRFDVPAEEAELEALSRTTTLDQESPIDEDSTAPEIREQSSVETAETTPDDGSATLVKKKKTHRGKRGGQRKPRKSKEEEEVDRAVNAAKELDRAPSLHPDEITSNGDDVQDVSNIKKIGKLTIDFDSLLGNGSGGTFVFKGKWNVSIGSVITSYLS